MKNAADIQSVWKLAVKTTKPNVFIANADIILNERMESIFCYVNLYVGDCTSQVEWHQKLLKGAVCTCRSRVGLQLDSTCHNKHYLFLLCLESDSNKMWNKLCQCKDHCTRLSVRLSLSKVLTWRNPLFLLSKNVNNQILSLSDLWTNVQWNVWGRDPSWSLAVT